MEWTKTSDKDPIQGHPIIFFDKIGKCFYFGHFYKRGFVDESGVVSNRSRIPFYVELDELICGYSLEDIFGLINCKA